MKRIVPYFSLTALMVVLAGCGSAENTAASPTFGPEPGGYETREWLDFFLSGEAMPYEENIDLELPEFPGVVFRWNNGLSVTAVTESGETLLFNGMPIWNIYLSDLNGDGLPEFCATASWGSGIVNESIEVYDYAAGVPYSLNDRFTYDYNLIIQDGQLLVYRFPSWGNKDPMVVGELALVPSDNEDESYILTLVNEREVDVSEIFQEE